MEVNGDQKLFGYQFLFLIIFFIYSLGTKEVDY